MTMLAEVTNKLKKIFKSPTQVQHTASVVIEEVNPAPLYAITLKVEAAKRDFDLADRQLRLFRAEHSLDFGEEFYTLFCARRDAAYNLEIKLHELNALRKFLVLTSQLQGGKCVRTAN